MHVRKGILSLNLLSSKTSNMKYRLFIILFSSLLLFSCGKKESAQSIAQKWCDLNAKVHNAKDETEKEAAKMEREKYEDKMEAKYKDDKNFMKEIERETEKCEAASEGK
jgi:hypothetical protein